MQGPFDWIRPEVRGRAFASLTLLFLVSTALIMGLDRQLVTEAAPNGIVSFELARQEASAHKILSAWSAHATHIALLLQGADYLYLLIYPAWFSFACWLVSRSLSSPWRPSGAAAAWLVWLATPCDAVENVALIMQLLYGANGTQAAVAFWCAAAKFGVLIVAVLYLLGAFFPWLKARVHRAASVA